MSTSSPCHKKIKTAFEATSLHTCSPWFHRSEELPYVAPVQPSPVLSTPRSSSRLTNSLLKYTPGQYTTMLRSNIVHAQETTTSTTQTAPLSSSYVQTSNEDGTSESPTAPELSSATSPRARTSPSQIYTPFMKLMEMSSKMSIDWMKFYWNGSWWNMKYFCFVTAHVTLPYICKKPKDLWITYFSDALYFALFTKYLVILCDSPIYFTVIYLYFHFSEPIFVWIIF